MKIAYLITAYDNPAHLKRLLDAIVTSRSAAFVHVDAKSSIEQFDGCRGARVHFIRDRVEVYWGEFGMTDAVLRLMRAAVHADEAFDYLLLISGTDYPIRPIAELEAFLAANAGSQFMNLVRMPAEAFGKPIWRLERYKVQRNARFARLRRALHRLLTATRLISATRDYRKALRGMTPYGGTTWWALTREASQYVLDFVARDRAFLKFYRHTIVPDEGMFHTIIGNSPFAARVRRNLTYTDWRAGGNHPRPIDREHLLRFFAREPVCSDDRFGPGSLFFARKFGDDAAALVDELDRFIVRAAACASEETGVSAPGHNNIDTLTAPPGGVQT